jgi:hypothetical protein
VGRRSVVIQAGTAISEVALALTIVLASGACVSHGSRSPDAGALNDGGACLPPLATDCAVAFMPTFTNIYDSLLIKTCGSPTSGTSCHGPNGAQAGLVLDGLDTAYDDLLGAGADQRARVVPRQPECSILVQRLESNDLNFRMPLGRTPLSAGIRCAVRKWIADGAIK